MGHYLREKLQSHASPLPLYIGGAGTVAWLFSLSAYLWGHEQNYSVLDKLNPADFGNFLAGAFAPLAFMWLVVATLLQRNELEQNRNALLLQAEELRASVEQFTNQTTFMHAENEALLRDQKIKSIQLGLRSDLIFLMDIAIDEPGIHFSRHEKATSPDQIGDGTFSIIGDSDKIGDFLESGKFFQLSNYLMSEIETSIRLLRNVDGVCSIEDLLAADGLAMLSSAVGKMEDLSLKFRAADDLVLREIFDATGLGRVGTKISKLERELQQYKTSNKL